MLLHPFPFARAIWSRLTDVLAARHRVIAVDTRGFGESPLGDDGYAMDDLADDLAALLAELGIARAAVLGMSMGGYAALAFAVRHPARLAALVLCDTRAEADSARPARRATAPSAASRRPARDPTSTAAWHGCSLRRRRRRQSASCATGQRRAPPA